MARIPTSAQLGSPNYGGGRAIRSVPNVEVPTFDVPVPNLPQQVSTPTVNIQAPDIPGSVPVANDVNLPQVQIPDTLYTSGQINALGDPGRAWANFGRTITSEADRWGTIFVALEKEKAGIAETEGFLRIEKELANDQQYKTWLPRYQTAAAKVKADALSNFSMPNHAERFARDFDNRVLAESTRIEKLAYAREADAGRAELAKVLDTRERQLDEPLISDTDRAKARQEAADAIDKARDLGYIDAEYAEVRKLKFAQDTAVTASVNQAARGDTEGALTDLDGGKGLAALQKADPEVQEGMAKAAEESGMPLNWLAEMAVARSGFNGVDEEGRRTGLFKMSDIEWANAFNAYVARTGIDKQNGMDQLSPFQYDSVMQGLRADPVVEAAVVAESMYEAQATLEQSIQSERPITLKDIMLYQNPVLGKDLAVSLLQGTLVEPNASIDDLLSDKMMAALRIDRNDTLKQAYDFLTEGIGDGSLPSVYTDLDAPNRQALRNKIEDVAYKESSEAKKQRELNKSQLEQNAKSNLGEMQDEGMSSIAIEPQQFIDAYGPVHGPVKALEYHRSLDTARAINERVDEIPTKASGTALDDYVKSLDPRFDNGPEADLDRSERVKVYNAVKAAADKAKTLRKNDPALAADEHTDVLAVIDSYNELEAAQPPDGVLPDDFMFKKKRAIAEARLSAQAKLGIAQVTVTKADAEEIMSKVKGHNLESKDALRAVVNDVETIYGAELGKKVMADSIAYHTKNEKKRAIGNKIVSKLFDGDEIDGEDMFRDLIAWQNDNASQGFMAPSGSGSPGRYLKPELMNAPKAFPKPPPAAIERLRAEASLAKPFAEKYGIDALIKLIPTLMTPLPPIK